MHIGSNKLLTRGWGDTSRGRPSGLRGLGGGLGGGVGGGGGSEAAADKGLEAGSAGPWGSCRCACTA